VLRAGLAQLEREEPVRRGPYPGAVSLGRSRLADIDDVSEALATCDSGFARFEKLEWFDPLRG